jgi:hypothetical protein
MRDSARELFNGSVERQSRGICRPNDSCLSNDRLDEFFTITLCNICTTLSCKEYASFHARTGTMAATTEAFLSPTAEQRNDVPIDVC